MVDGARRVIALRVGFTRSKTCQQSHTLINRFDRHEAKPFLGRSGDDVPAQHQVFDIAYRDDDALLPGKPGYAASVKKALDLLVDTADRLDSAELIDRAGHGEGLTDRHFGKRRQQ